MARECGTCVACCTALRVSDVPSKHKGQPVHMKPPGKPCVHLTESGCGIYETRPKGCRDWSCGWLQGYSDLGQPNEWGIIVDEREPTPNFGPSTMVHEVREGAFSEKGPREFIDGLSKHEIVMMAYADGRRGIRGPSVRAEVHPPSPEHAKSPKHHLRIVR
jgi:hypothetical protein